ncbi:SIS domain-containing protein [Azospirillum picis]|uniref:RpiR family carbohydrate utilization transcriptional regulator n=1 Tax=Azospirillum picis TaxID=488438 RepID=A0ABU0MHQ9_9PROT|nr:SIS domain-containing protein [Azospirillum picis]MBP2299404.1 RpiR family carbohydrate utilization transcriptional regulator [Azospirillum picis]MDQ0532958.1 RpiR family carbohydrate utilization transcriptional regulator [Azospirillum picis]
MTPPVNGAPVDILDQIRRLHGGLKPSEARIADLVLAEPRRILELNVTSLAQAADVSEATVVRFCRSVGCSGFPDFKLRLAECQARDEFRDRTGGGTPYVSQDVAADDDVATLARKIFSSGAAALTAAAAALDEEALERAIALLAEAPRVLCVGTGGSSALAQDAAHKLLRFGADAQPCADPVLARMLLVNLEAGGVLLALSNTGRSGTINELAAAAKAQGTAVVAITAPKSPLAAMASVVVASQPVEDTEMYTPMASRLVHLTLIDVLSTGVALRLGDPAVRQLARVKAAINAGRLPPLA